MTIEEVIKELKEYEDGLDLEYATPFDKAILYAIQALSQESLDNMPCVTKEEMQKCKEVVKKYTSSVTQNTECLKAQAKKQAMPMSCDDCCYEPNSPFCEMYRKDICEKKDERQSGKWIPNYYFYGIYDYTCSECEKHSKERSAFCPKCGTKMESEE